VLSHSRWTHFWGVATPPIQALSALVISGGRTGLGCIAELDEDGLARARAFDVGAEEAQGAGHGLEQDERHATHSSPGLVETARGQNGCTLGASPFDPATWNTPGQPAC
jgi:hypothetical protein